MLSARFRDDMLSLHEKMSGWLIFRDGLISCIAGFPELPQRTPCRLIDSQRL